MESRGKNKINQLKGVNLETHDFINHNKDKRTDLGLMTKWYMSSKKYENPLVLFKNFPRLLLEIPM